MQSFDYQQWIVDLKKRYLIQQTKAAIRVNQAMLQFYWDLGQDIAHRDLENAYGTAFYKKLSDDLKQLLPNIKGFSPSNLRYAKTFFMLYSGVNEIYPQPVGKLSTSIPQELQRREIPEVLATLPWGHHRYIIDRCAKEPQRALFYVQKSIENNWSRAVLINFLNTHLYEREGNAISNFKLTLPQPQSDLAQEMTRDPYHFDFLKLTESYREHELKVALTQNILRFLLELGRGFAFIGREYRLEIGETEQYIDLLFYHITLRCYVVIEVKTGEFAPEHLGQLGTYVVAVNHQLKQADENPTIGLLICKTKDDVLAQYALEGSSLPIAVSEYELEKLYPKNLKSALPSIEDIEQELSSNSTLKL